MSVEEEHNPLPQPPTLPEIYRKVKQYADAIEEEDEFRELMDSPDYQYNPSYGYLVHDGIRRAISVLQLLSIVDDPVTHQDLHRQIDHEAIPGNTGVWIHDLLFGSPRDNETSIYYTDETIPEGLEPSSSLSVLLRMKKRHIQEEVLDYITGDTDIVQMRSFLRHIQALTAGHDFIINKYKEVWAESGLLPASEDATDQQ
jgi:hypothetical protein